MTSVEDAGFQFLDGLLSPGILSDLRNESDRLLGATHEAGIRSLVSRSPTMLGFAESKEVRDVIETCLGANAFLARSILFDKHRHANWDVTWHQDTTIAVAARRDEPGFGPWSIKDGVPHVRPPAAILSRMITLRVHLDDTSVENGALFVIPGSHRHGILSADEIARLVAGTPQVVCERGAGDAMLMRPLVLHSSKKSIFPTRRRVVHLEFATGELPSGLAWKLC